MKIELSYLTIADSYEKVNLISIYVKEQQKISNSSKVIRLPIVVGITLVAGILIGATFFGNKKMSGDVVKSSNIFKEILMYVDRSYVDEVDTDSLADYGIAKMLEKLDPHTAYLPVEQAKMAREELNNNFDGIGVEFNIYEDTLYVVTPLSGGPSEEVGIQSGDAIISANTTKLYGPSLDNPLVFKTLRGERGTEVKLKIKRPGFKDLLDFTVVRNKIPTYSVDAAYMIDAQTGYIKVSRFSITTYDEFKNHLSDLKKKGMSRLLLDLRGNGGGYLDRATDIADEMIGGNDVIVYTDGKDDNVDQKIFAGNKGMFEQGKLVVLVDEGSASASEIVSGALQDYDRGVIVGRRTFGKGLVQAPITLSDGSELRLTISRYYIPSGRSIQKPYTSGNLDEYYDELGVRGKNGEYINADSVKSKKGKPYKTKGGRTVYGGGGITPDVFVPRDTTYSSRYLFELYGKNIIREFALEYANKNKKTLEKQRFEQFLNSFEVSESQLKEIIAMGTKAGVKYKADDFARSKSFIKSQVKANIARQIWRESDGLNNNFYRVIHKDDEMIQTAMKQFNKELKM
jgi:carboxyl-terminal processing protease